MLRVGCVLAGAGQSVVCVVIVNGSATAANDTTQVRCTAEQQVGRLL